MWMQVFLTERTSNACASMKLHDQHAKYILVGKIAGCRDFGQTAQKFAKRVRAGFRRVVGREKFEQAIAHARLFFVDDGVARRR